MAELNAIVGTILRELAQARYMSDTYSRHLSKIYERDSMLRMFPVPRAEINEIDLSLKFAIANIEEVEQKPADLLNRLFANHVETITEDVLQAMAGSERLLNYFPQWQSFSQTLIKQGLADDIQSALLDALDNNIPKFLEEGTFMQEDNADNSTAKTSAKSTVAVKITGLQIEYDLLYSVISDTIYDSIFEKPTVKAKLLELESADEDAPSVMGSLKSTISANIRDRVYLLQNALLELDLESMFALDVITASDELANFPESTLTSITIKTKVRNYLWTQIDEQGGKSVRKLSPE